ncbi:MAG TPA: hypothetical protein VJJ20_00110 [Candidatus Paceibacterota bacterium]
MASYSDPTLRARLNEIARPEVTKNHFGDKGYFDHQVGITKIHLDQGLMYIQIGWGIDGMDNPISSDVAETIDTFEITFSNLVRRTAGIYILRDKDKKKTVLARARVQDSRYQGNDSSDIIVSGKERNDVVKLFTLIQAGKLRPDIENEEFKQIEGAVNELKRLRRENPALRRQVQSRDETIQSLNGQLSDVRRQLSGIQAAAAKQ